MILFRILLLMVIVYLVIKAFLGFGTHRHGSKPQPVRDDDSQSKKVSKEIGEYVDFEEVKKEKQHSSSPKS